MGASLILAAAGLLRPRPMHLLALVGPLLPFVMTGLTAYEDPNWRRVGAMLVPAPVCLGVAWACLLEAERGSLLGDLLARLDRDTVGGRFTRSTALFAGVFAVAVVVGLPYTAIAPSAPTRAPFLADSEWATVAAATGRGRPQEARCAARMLADQERGVPQAGFLGQFWWGGAPVEGTPFPDNGAPVPTRPSARDVPLVPTP